MKYLPNILFLLLFTAAVVYFATNVKKIIRNINLGLDVDRTDQKKLRLSNMIRIALGQSKMVSRPIAGILHIIVYVGFILINIELVEIVIDGVFGTHRVFYPLGGIYNYLIAIFEILAFLVLITVIIFWFRRNALNIKRFVTLKGWPKQDGNNILYFEIVLMLLFLTMNATDYQLQLLGVDHYAKAEGIAGDFPISSWLIHPFIQNLSIETLIVFERVAWWSHIIGILIFLNYLYYSKHLHILLAFPNVYYADLKPMGHLNNLEAVTKEVQLMMDPDADPYAAPAEGVEDVAVAKFGASEVTDLNWVQLMNSYSCTECGRCTSECPANLTGKKLSPRKIMMDTRDRLQEVGENIDANNGEFKDDGKQLLGDYITKEELWACTTCNACVEACPISISPLSIILDMRRYLVMEESAAPTELNNMMSNIENNGAPWPYNQMDRLNWVDE